MKSDEQMEIEKSREYLVVKSNTLISNVTRRKNGLTVLEQRALAFIISQIKPPENITSKPVYKYTFDIKQFCRVCGLKSDSGTNYDNVKAALSRLADNGFWIDEGDTEEMYFQWIYAPRINKRSGRISVRISEDAMPYLWNLQERFTRYELYQILSLKSAYSIAMYELMKCNAFKKKYECTIDYLRSYLAVEGKHKDFRDFRRIVLEPSIKEINLYTDLTIKPEPVRSGRAYTKIVFTIEQKEKWEGYEAYRRTICDLNGVKYEPGQATLFE